MDEEHSQQWEQKCKDPETGLCLEYSRKHKEVTLSRAKWEGGRVIGGEV